MNSRNNTKSPQENSAPSLRTSTPASLSLLRENSSRSFQTTGSYSSELAEPEELPEDESG